MFWKITQRQVKERAWGNQGEKVERGGGGQEFPVRILTCVSLGILHVSFHLLLTRLPWRKKVLTF